MASVKIDRTRAIRDHGPVGEGESCERCGSPNDRHRTPPEDPLHPAIPVVRNGVTVCRTCARGLRTMRVPRTTRIVWSHIRRRDWA